jgi:hypothetical protein
MKKKKNHTLLVLFLTMFYPLCHAQDFQTNKHSEKFIKTCVQEVYGNKANELVLNTSSRRLAMITDFFSRVEIVKLTKTAQEKIPAISYLKLNNKYNQNLTYDLKYEENLFNPLKYHFNMYPSILKKYRIDDFYIISIKPVK